MELELTEVDRDGAVTLHAVDRFDGDERVAFLSIITEDGEPLHVIMYDEDGESRTLWSAP